MKIIAFYLPQFHVIPENEKKWGEGFTEWDNVKKGKKMFKNHYQPRVPFENNYYNLLDEKVLEKQSCLAQKYGVYGFCFYHYWFGDKQLLEKPMEMYLKNSKCKLPFCISWANESWTNIWKADTTLEIFVEQKYYGKEEWKKHFEYLLPFFKDNRYIKENNMPVVVIYRPYLFEQMDEMMKFWNQLALEHGFDGIYFLSQRFEEKYQNHKSFLLFKGHIQYYPYRYFANYDRAIPTIKERIFRLYMRYMKNGLNVFTYDEVWRYILQDEIGEKTIPGAFVDWDNSARTGKKGTIVFGASPKKFKNYLFKQIQRAESMQKEYLFIFAWNEWGEGGYLEPDSKFGYQYLEMIRDVLSE